jgi:hypothetical protein
MQTMITLATLAAIGATERPSGEELVIQAERISTGITTQLADTSLATGNNWELSWLGLSEDRANLAFIAVSTSLNAITVSIRGTLFSSMIDLGEDLDVGSLAQFTAGTTSTTTPPLLVSKGANTGFAEVTSAVDVRSGAQYQNTVLIDALIQIMASNQLGSNPTLYVTGHSLGGALATMVALYLKIWEFLNTVTFAVYTFAAPTAGLQEFAEYYDQVLTNNSPNQTWRVYNVWDAVPNAWASLGTLKGFYPNPPGPAQDTDVKIIIDDVLPSMPGNNVYVQTNINTNSYPINTEPYGTKGTYDPEFVDKTTADFFGQVAWQHNDYVAMLGAPPLGSVPPIVTSVTPNSGTSDGSVLVTINGSGFGPYNQYPTYVDFGALAGGSTFEVKSDSVIQGYSPTGAGVLDVRVTTMYGTSAVRASDPLD